MRNPFPFALLLAISLLPMVSAQDAAKQAPVDESSLATYVPSMTFDVASIRQAKPDPNGWVRVGGQFEPANSSHITLENVDLRYLLELAYPGRDHKVDGWRNLQDDLRSVMFDVRAEASPEADERLSKLPEKQVRLEQAHMVQALLAERFNLKVHWETRDSSTFDLVLSKRGRLKSTGAQPSADEVQRFGDRPVPPLYQKGDSREGFEYIAHGATVNNLANMLGGQFGVPVNDKTGLTGKYDFDLKTYQTATSERSDDETNPWPPLETAIQDQLGLKLVPSHGPVKFLVIDHAEKPSPN
ncbi:MAG TPA: TIGR03435 family protein [Terracidiphilus sp.]|nr:TIGR03435 family protein [Terracidiphilus sp.]